MTLRRLTNAERRDRLRLVRTPNIGPLTFARPIERYGNAGDAMAALPEIASLMARGRKITLPPVSAIEDEMAATARCGARIIASCEPDFP
ncbi:hypothetical protein [Hyphomonas sp.]|uniref:hypothetical protein n=1 Tax=Hyphomonas sp. TaxID=87 RepID=UPI0025B7F69D|nr:hypothetical protein [Hyphomonas sp.]